MVSLSSLLWIGSAVASVFAATNNSTGTNNGYYYSFWRDSASNVTYTNEAAGQYYLEWSNSQGNFMGGKGWNPGSPRQDLDPSCNPHETDFRLPCRLINYFGYTYTPNDNVYVAVHGWTQNPLVEYYILESYGAFNPASGATKLGSVTTDGGTYDILATTRTQQPSIEGIKTFQQYWSVRSGPRIGGTVNTANHFDAWSALGLPLGSHNYQMLAVVGFGQASGQARMYVDTGVSPSSFTAQYVDIVDSHSVLNYSALQSTPHALAEDISLPRAAASLDLPARPRTRGSPNACRKLLSFSSSFPSIRPCSSFCGMLGTESCFRVDLSA